MNIGTGDGKWKAKKKPFGWPHVLIVLISAWLASEGAVAAIVKAGEGWSALLDPQYVLVWMKPVGGVLLASLTRFVGER
jgi:hypothetical protein